MLMLIRRLICFYQVCWKPEIIDHHDKKFTPSYSSSGKIYRASGWYLTCVFKRVHSAGGYWNVVLNYWTSSFCRPGDLTLKFVFTQLNLDWIPRLLIFQSTCTQGPQYHGAYPYLTCIPARETHGNIHRIIHHDGRPCVVWLCYKLKTTDSLFDRSIAIHPSKVDDFTLVSHVDFVILSFFAVFAIFILPSLIARFSRRSEWLCGLFLHACSPINVQKPYRTNTLSSSSSHLVANNNLRPRSSWRDSHWMQTKIADNAQLPSGRVPSWSGRFPTVSAILGREATSGHSVGHLIIFLGYFGIISYAGLYQSTPFIHSIREGTIVMSQIPIVFALATKNSVLGTVLAVGYEKFNWLHRFIGRLMLVLATIHALGYIYTWPFTHQMEPLPMEGIITFMSLNLLAGFSTASFRQNYYNIFLITHITGFILLPIGLIRHAPAAAPYIYTGIGIYLLDHVVRILKTRVTDATLTPISELKSTRIEINRLGAGWRPGQHVRIRVISRKMGWFGWGEAHPFTIAGISGERMVLMCKSTGDWTNKLYQLAQGGKSFEEDIGQRRNVTVVVEGPYGGVGHTLMDSFSGALLVSGGSGITFSLAVVQDLVIKAVAGTSHVNTIELVWSVPDPNSLTPMLSIFESLISEAPSVTVHVTVFYTRALKAPLDFKETLPANVVLIPGRPEISKIISSVIGRTCASSPNPLGLVVGVCGPAALGQNVRNAVGTVDSALRKQVGGIELCEEVFGL